jgi:hypothetical protein
MIEQLTRTIADRVAGPRPVASALRQYLDALLGELNAPSAPTRTPIDLAALPDRVFETLVSREFCSLSLGRVAGSRDAVVASVARALRRSEPIHFYYGLGGGYATSFRSPSTPRVPEVGLAEVLLLRQATELAGRVSALYPPGVRFSLVIDNLSAYLVEDVPVTQTVAYCRKLRQLVDDLGLSALTDLIVTSEYFSVSDFAEAWPSGEDVPDVGTLTNKPHRVAGREAICVDQAADAELMRRAHAARQAAEQLLAPMIRGVYLTGRTTVESLGFRPFPGGESCAERGEVVVTRKGRTALGPMVLTSATHADYAIERYRFPGVLPPSIDEVGYAERLRG